MLSKGQSGATRHATMQVSKHSGAVQHSAPDASISQFCELAAHGSPRSPGSSVLSALSTVPLLDDSVEEPVGDEELVTPPDSGPVVAVGVVLVPCSVTVPAEVCDPVVTSAELEAVEEVEEVLVDDSPLCSGLSMRQPTASPKESRGAQRSTYGFLGRVSGVVKLSVPRTQTRRSLRSTGGLLRATSSGLTALLELFCAFYFG